MNSNARSIIRIAFWTFFFNMIAFAGFITGAIAQDSQQPATVKTAVIVKVEKVPAVAYIIKREKASDGRWYLAVWDSASAKIITGRIQDNHPCKKLALNKPYQVRFYGIRLMELANGPCFVLLQPEEFFFKQVVKPSVKVDLIPATWDGSSWRCDDGWMLWSSKDFKKQDVSSFAYCLPSAGFSDETGRDK